MITEHHDPGVTHHWGRADGDVRGIQSSGKITGLAQSRAFIVAVRRSNEGKQASHINIVNVPAPQVWLLPCHRGKVVVAAVERESIVSQGSPLWVENPGGAGHGRGKSGCDMTKTLVRPKRDCSDVIKQLRGEKDLL